MKSTTVLACILLFGLVIHLTFLRSPIDRDSGFFMTSGMLIANGKILYKDVFDFKPPGMHYTAAIIFKIVGNSFIGFKFFIMIANLASALLLFEICRLLWGAESGLLAAFLFLFGLPLFDGTQFLSEQLVMLFTGAGLLYYIKYLKSDKQALSILMGLSFGVAMLFKQIAFLFLLVVLCHSLLLRKRIRSVYVLVLTSVIPLALFLAYFAANGALQDALVSLSSITRWYKPNPLGETIEYSYQNFIAYPLVWILSLASVSILLTEKRRSSDKSLIHYLFIISLVPTFFQQFPHYYIPTLYFGCLLSARTLIDLRQASAALKRAGMAYTVLLIVFLMFLPSVFKLAVEYHYLGEYRMLDKFIEASDYVRQNTRPNEKVLVVPNEPEIYFLSEREPPVKYLHLDYSSYYDGIEDYILNETARYGVRYYVVRESHYLDEYASKIHSQIRNQSLLEETVDDTYPLRIYRQVK